MKFLPVLLLAVAATYWPGLAGDFAFDDYANIVNNPSLRIFDGSLASLLSASGEGMASPLGRPLSLASFAVNLYFGGDSPFHFKASNLLIHLATGLLVYLLIRQLWPRLVGDGRDAPAALWVAALWLFHPINLTPVLFVVQRMTSLAAFFTLAALCLYLYGRQQHGRKRWLALAAGLLLCWPAGILAKESALLLPLFILLGEWLSPEGFRAIPAKYRLPIGTLAVAAVLAALLAGWPLIQGSYSIRDFTLGERLLTEARVLWFYTGQMLFPSPDLFGLHHDDIPISRGLLSPPSTLIAIAAWALTLTLALAWRKRQAWLSFAVLWYLAAHALESSILGLEIAYEHRNYLSSIGIFFGLAVVLFRVRENAKGEVPRIALALGFVTLCAVLTGLRAAQWGDEYIRTQIEANDHPRSARTHFAAGRAILAKTLPTGSINSAAYNIARIHFQRAAKLDPYGKAAPASVLYLDCAVGMKKDVEMQQMLIARLARERFTLEDQGFIRELSNMLVNNALCMNGEEVDALLAAALSNPLANARVRGMFHAVAMDYAAAGLDSLPRAKMHAIAAVDSDPGNAVLHINLIRVLLQLGETNEAKRQYATLTKLRIPAANRAEVENLALGLRQ